MDKEPSPIWHPFTQHAIVRDIPQIDRAEGAYLYTAGGERIIDAVSSWWVITHGHCTARIKKAIQDQAEKLDQIIFAGHSHEPAEQLAKHLMDMTPKGLEYLFFSDSGSISVEVALKMACGFWYHQGSPRNRFIMLENGYHGDTIGAMSLSARGVFTKPYGALLFKVDQIPFPEKANEQKTLDQLEKLCTQHKDQIAALIIEPLIQGAGGMNIYPAWVLREMKKICEHHNILLIADEVMTGFGRTGTLFACDQAGITPDILCLGKGLTGGFLPLAVTLCHKKIYDAHYSTDTSRTFFHSSSYTANPLACAAALENLKIWRDEPVQERIDALARYQTKKLSQIAQDDRLENIRQIGTITAMDIKVKDKGYLSGIAPKLADYYSTKGLLLRPLGNTVYILPPYCITEPDLDQIYDAISDSLDALEL